MQGVVFNAHYLAYLDDAMDQWMRTLDQNFERLGYDIMVGHVVLDWLGSAGLGDVVELDWRWRGGGPPRSPSRRRCTSVIGRARRLIAYVGVRPGATSGRSARSVHDHLDEASVSS